MTHISKRSTQTHEYLGHGEEVKAGSDRSFGLVFAGVFVIIALFPLLGGRPVRLWSLIVAGVLVGVAMLRPGLLAPANRLWLAFGLLLHRVTSPLVLGLLFFLVFTPMGFVMRVLRKDPLRVQWDGSAPSYWIPRRPPGPEPDTMRNQF
ncbi:MAG TPA: SxtJ family membrane protein [Methylomirabilota bacterium]|jgi:hypothetical protein